MTDRLAGTAAPVAAASGRLRRALWILFFLSGAASLTYQVAWQRVLTQVIGIDAFSVALIVSIFMLGLGGGGLLGAILVRRARNLVLIYAATELILGVFGAFSIALIRELGTLLVPYTPGLGVEFASYFALLALPTLLMGLTLPLMVHFVRRLYPSGEALGTIYSANIAGAAAGTLFAGFVLVGMLGLIATCRWIAALNVAIALAIVATARTGGDLSAPERTHPRPVRHRYVWLFLAISFVTGFVALGYEIVFFRLFTTYFGMVSYVFPMLLFSYLLSMAVGTRVFGRLADTYRAADLAVVIVIGALATTLIILYTPALLLTLNLNQEALVLTEVVSRDLAAGLVRILAMSVVLLVPVTFISGLFPVLVRVLDSDREVLGNSTGLVYFTQTMGNFIGAVATGLVLLPVIGTIPTLRLFAALLIVIPIGLWIVERRDGLTAAPRRFFLAAVAGIAILVLFPGWYYQSIHNFYDAYRFNLGRSVAAGAIIENALGVTFAYPTPEGYWVNIGRDRSSPIYVDPKAWEIWPLEFLPPLTPHARRALIVGIGPAMHVPVLQRLYPGIAIDVVEINPALMTLIRTHAGGGVVEALKQANVYETDGRRFVLKNPNNRYDIIQVGLNHATLSGSGNLFTEEFFATLKDMLAPDGVLTIQAFTAAVKAAMGVFDNVAVVSPGDDIAAARAAAASVHAVGSGPGVAHMIAWKTPGARLFHDRLTSDAARVPSVIPVDPRAPIPAARPNWDGGCILFRAELAPLLAPVRAATDDLPVTEYFLTQRQAVQGADASKDARYFGCSSKAIPLRALERPPSS